MQIIKISVQLCGLVAFTCQKKKKKRSFIQIKHIRKTLANRDLDKCNTGQCQEWYNALGHVLVGRSVGGTSKGGSWQGAPSNAGGLALLADRWLVNISPQFVLPRSPASSHISCPLPQSGSESAFWWTKEEVCTIDHVFLLLEPDTTVADYFVVCTWWFALLHCKSPTIFCSAKNTSRSCFESDIHGKGRMWEIISLVLREFILNFSFTDLNLNKLEVKLSPLRLSHLF